MMGYVNTRIAAMRAALMDRKSVEELLEAPDERAFLDRLLSSPYGESLAECLTDGSPRTALNHALLSNMSTCFDRIVAFTPSELKPDLDVLFEFLDVQAMKSIIRGLHGKLPPDVIRTGACTGSRLTVAQIEVLSEEADVKSAIDQLVTWGHPFGVALRKPMESYRLDGDPGVLEGALDHLRYDVSDKHPAAELIAIEAEIRNVMNALTSLDSERKPTIFNQGTRPTRLISSLHQASSPTEAIALLADSHFNHVLDKALPMLLMDQSRFALLERLMDEVLIREVGRMALLDPESLAVPYQYILLKRNEVMNIRLIGIGLMDGLLRNIIRSALVFKEVA
jgi:vacuolar-type H+-ATPase subunit C/Vma6